MITILMAFAFVTLLLAAFGVGMPRMALGRLGLALWCLTHVLGRALLIAALVVGPFLSMPQKAEAGPQGCTGYSELAGFAHETLTVAGTAVGLTATVYAPAGTRPADMAVVTVESFAVRYWDDGVAPTATVGMPISAGLGAYVCGSQAVKQIQFIRQTSSATLSVSYYRVTQ